MYCHHCGSEIKTDRKIGRQETCSNCSCNLHCCLNCKFYDPDVYHQCRETEAEWVQDKASANFCDYFDPSDRPVKRKSERSEQARKKLDQLFGKQS
jgi:hypothetical protein